MIIIQRYFNGFADGDLQQSVRDPLDGFKGPTQPEGKASDCNCGESECDDLHGLAVGLHPLHFRCYVLEEQNSRDRGLTAKIPQGIRIKINKEKKIVNHLSTNHENTNLLFYNFNSFNDSSNNLSGVQGGAGSGGKGERVPTRGGVKSRKEVRERLVATADHHAPSFTLSLGFNKSNFHN